MGDVLIVSLGTGLYNAGIEITSGGNWGASQWLFGKDSNGRSTEPLINVLAMSNVLAPCAQLQSLLPRNNYYRLEPIIPYEESTLDGTDTQELLATAQGYIASGGTGYETFLSVIAALRSS